MAPVKTTTKPSVYTEDDGALPPSLSRHLDAMKASLQAGVLDSESTQSLSPEQRGAQVWLEEAKKAVAKASHYPLKGVAVRVIREGDPENALVKFTMTVDLGAVRGDDGQLVSPGRRYTTVGMLTYEVERQAKAEEYAYPLLNGMLVKVLSRIEVDHARPIRCPMLRCFGESHRQPVLGVKAYKCDKCGAYTVECPICREVNTSRETIDKCPDCGAELRVEPEPAEEVEEVERWEPRGPVQGRPRRTRRR